MDCTLIVAYYKVTTVMTHFKIKRTITCTLKLLSLIKRLHPISVLLNAVPLKAEVADTRDLQK